MPFDEISYAFGWPYVVDVNRYFSTNAYLSNVTLVYCKLFIKNYENEIWSKFLLWYCQYMCITRKEFKYKHMNSIGLKLIANILDVDNILLNINASQWFCDGDSNLTKYQNIIISNSHLSSQDVITINVFFNINPKVKIIFMLVFPLMDLNCVGERNIFSSVIHVRNLWYYRCRCNENQCL